MIKEQLTVGLAVECRALTGPWGGVAWRPVAVFVAAPEVEPWTPLGTFGESNRYYAGAYDVDLYAIDTANYRDNLESGSPKLWVVMRADGPEPPIEILLVTADPAEGEASTEAGSNIVETIAMPAEIAGALAEFVVAHHVERPVYKRRRDRGRSSRQPMPGMPGNAGQGGDGSDGGGGGQ